MKAKGFLWLVFALLFIGRVGAQDLIFSGGAGRGNTLQNIGPRLLSGDPLVLDFRGGNGHGSVVRSLGQTQLNGSQLILNYLGGSGNGSDRDGVANSTLSGTIQTLTFSGGRGHGSNSLKSELISLSGNIAGNPNFPGGNGRGDFSLARAQSLLDGSSVPINFFGGSGSGDVLRPSRVISLTGADFIPVYPGGSGRGDLSRKTNPLTIGGIAAGSFSRYASSKVYNFRAFPENRKTRLQWNAFENEELEHFVVEKSFDGQNFDRVGIVSREAVRLNGNYHFPSLALEQKEEFFRLLEVFKDSSFSYSEVLKVAFQNPKQMVSLYPNPAHEQLTVRISSPEENARIILIGPSGNRIRVIPMNAIPEIKLDLNDLPPGFYWLEFESSTESQRLRFNRL